MASAVPACPQSLGAMSSARFAGVEPPTARQQVRSFHLVHPLAGEDGSDALIGGP